MTPSSTEVYQALHLVWRSGRLVRPERCDVCEP